MPQPAYHAAPMAAARPPQPNGPRPYNTARRYPTVGQLRPPPQTWIPWDVSEDVVCPRTSPLHSLFYRAIPSSYVIARTGKASLCMC